MKRRGRVQPEGTKKSKTGESSESHRRATLSSDSGFASGSQLIRRRPETDFTQANIVGSASEDTAVDLVDLVERSRYHQQQAALFEKEQEQKKVKEAKEEKERSEKHLPEKKKEMAKRGNEESVDQAMEASTSATTSSTSAGGSGRVGGGNAGDPIPMAFPQHQRAVDHFTLKAAGTTFIKPGVSTTSDNLWSRFPWELIQPFINDWTVFELCDKYLMWKTQNIGITFKNPLCIQEVGTNLATAGQNLHANLFGYMDNMYINGTYNPFNVGGTDTEVEINTLMLSWKHHGYSGGLPISLPQYTFADDTLLWQNNWPDVKQCGMGPGKSMSFAWNVNNKYWKSTDLFKSLPRLSPATTFQQGMFCRWDERFGHISRVLHPATSHTLRSPNANKQGVTNLERSQWQSGIYGGNTTNQTSVFYMDPDPIPGLYLQLQPQLGAISTGISDSICQVQWELTVNIVCSGRLPRMSNDGAINNQRNPDSMFGGPSAVAKDLQPFYYDFAITPQDTPN